VRGIFLTTNLRNNRELKRKTGEKPPVILLGWEEKSVKQWLFLSRKVWAGFFNTFNRKMRTIGDYPREEKKPLGLGETSRVRRTSRVWEHLSGMGTPLGYGRHLPYWVWETPTVLGIRHLPYWVYSTYRTGCSLPTVLGVASLPYVGASLPPYVGASLPPSVTCPSHCW